MFNRIAQTNHAVNIAADRDCPICMDGFENINDIITHDGSGEAHIFHLPCIRFWLGNHDDCPTCRLVITHVNGETIVDMRREVGAQIAAEAELRAIEEEELDRQREAEETERARALEALTTASGNGDLVRVEQLLERDFSSEELGTAVAVARQSRHEEVVDALFARSNTPEEVRSWAVVYSAEQGLEEMMDGFLEGHNISQDLRGLAVVRAATPGHFEIVQTLLGGGEIEEEHRGWATVKAAENGHVNIINILLQNGEIDQEDLKTALKKAAENDHLEVLNALLATREIDYVERGSVVMIAANANHTAIVAALLANGPIARTYRDIGLQIAIDNEAITQLLNNATIQELLIII